MGPDRSPLNALAPLDFESGHRLNATNWSNIL